MTRNFQKKLVLSFLLIFAVCTFVITIFEHRQIQIQQREKLQRELDAYVTVIALNDSLPALPSNLRITIMDIAGNVKYDNVVPDTLENHADRPEVIGAVKNGNFSVLRSSETNNITYLYYAKKNSDEIIRVALPYDKTVQFLLKPNYEFVYFVAAVFVIGLLFILYVGNFFGKSIRKLRDFSKLLYRDIDKINIPDFPKDEIGEIGERIIKNLQRIKEDERRLAQEREKLELHLKTSGEGICFFNADKTVAFYNGLFWQHLNLILPNKITVAVGKEILTDECFNPVIEFLNNRENEDYFETNITKQGKNFLLRLNISKDKSFEIILVDVTAIEKNSNLKVEMTGNIAHELRTPVTSIRGFLEILLGNNITEEKRKEYLQRAFAQTEKLSELISDMSLLTKMDGKAKEMQLREEVDVSKIIAKVYADFSTALEEKGIKFNSEVPQGLMVLGNSNLVYSIFSNLTNNVLRHAGTNVDISIKLQGIAENRAYFVFADNGKGIEDEVHLNRLFDRFYRVDGGRTRDSGGSGLGLSIVKNAVVIQGGSISVRKGEEKGLEFLFSLGVANP